MYAVIEYYNYPKDSCLTILHLFNDMEKAIEKAKFHAEMQSKEDSLQVTDVIENIYVDLTDCIEYFTTGNGHCRNIYAVLVLPDIEDSDKNQNA